MQKTATLKYKCATLKLPRRSRSTLWYVARLTPMAGIMAMLALLAALQPENTAAPTPVVVSESAAPSSVVNFSTLPAILSNVDSATYRQIGEAQQSSQWARADLLIALVSNKLLMGHVLADRYLSRHYESSPAELAEWLKTYGDHPEAADIYALAVAKTPSAKRDFEMPLKQAALHGYGDDNGLGRSIDTPLTKSWQKAVAAWKAGHSADAAKQFSAMLKDKDSLSPWTQSAAAYWSYRAYNATGDKAEAAKYLHLAATHPRSFYGILARRQLGQALNLDNEAVELSEIDVIEMIGEPSIRRILALTESGMSEVAEREMRALFPQADDNDKQRLLALAHTLNLASVQISMAKQMSDDSHTMDFAKYPVPFWQPKDGFTIDPALIFALARQESGFNASAVSPGGAFGVMQLMPKTASFMQKRIGDQANPSEPVMNITLGQNYIDHLLKNGLVDDNLIYLLAAYNAGPGRLQDWKQSLSSNDPLLFLESIPMRETRNYVMQVMANYWIYSELQGAPSRSVTALINGKWPSYDRTAGMAAARLAMDKAG